MLDSLPKLLEEQVKDPYSDEKQLLKALPRMLKGASNADLQAALKSHREEARVHVERLEQIAQVLGAKPAGKHCKGMEGLLEEGKEALEEEGEEAVLDAGLIAAAASASEDEDDEDEDDDDDEDEDEDEEEEEDEGEEEEEEETEAEEKKPAKAPAKSVNRR